MPVLDFILNCAFLLVWLNGRSRGLANLPQVPGVALIATLKSAQRRSSDRWPSTLVLVAGLFGRAIFYWQVETSAHWMPTIPLGPITLHFRSDMFMPMLLFSLLGFLLYLAVFYFALLLVAAVHRGALENDAWFGLVRAHLGVLTRWPTLLLVLAPGLTAFFLWLILGPLFGMLGLTTPALSFAQLARQAMVIGISAWQPWAYVIAVVFVLHIISSYVYLGRATFWSFINVTARSLLRPFTLLPLRVGKLDFAPLLGLALMTLIILYAPPGLTQIYQRLAF